MQLKRLLIILAVFVGVLVVAIMGMYKSWNAFTSGGIFGMLSSKEAIKWWMARARQSSSIIRQSES